jgi:hypothetical protein
MIPAYYTMIHFEVHIFAVFKNLSTLYRLGACVAGAFDVFLDWLFVNHFVFMALIYCAAVGRFLRLFT